MDKFLLVLLQLICINSILVLASCPVEDDPTNLARCIQVDVSAIVSVVKGTSDMSSFCALADRYMECFKTYTRGCVGFYFGEGTLTELQNIALYCCNGFDSTKDCPFNPNIKHSCIDSNANAILEDGSLRSIKSLKIGDKVKTLDKNGELIDTDVIMIMDMNNQNSLFLNIKTNTGKNIKVSASHLIATPNGNFRFAKNLNTGDSIITFNYARQTKVEELIVSILIEKVEGYSAPLTTAGTLLVDGILVSCYAIIKSHHLAHLAMAPVRWWYSMNEIVDQLFPSTILTSLQIEKQTNGTHWFPAFLHSFTSNTKLIKYL